MTEPNRPADLQIRSACPRTWASLAGEGGTRFCDECRLHVHDSRSLTRDEAHALVRDSAGRVCMRIVSDATGAPIYRDSRPPGSKVGRLAQWALATGAGLLAACHDDPKPSSGGAGAANGTTDPPPVTTENVPGPEVMGEVCAPAIEELGDVALPIETMGRVIAPPPSPMDR